MSVLVESGNLASAIAAVKGAVDRGSNIDILASCLVEASGGELSISATNLSIYSHAKAPCEGDMDAICAPFWLLESAARLKGRDLDISLSESRMTIRAGRSKFAGGVLPSGDFPQASPTFDTSFSLPSRTVASILAATSGFAGDGKDGRYFLTGVNIEASAGVLTAAAANGHMLSSAGVSVPGVPDFEPAIIPAATVGEIAAMAERSGGEDISFELGRTMISATAGSTRIVSKLIDGAFPDWRRVLPRESGNTISFDLGEMLGAADRAARIISDSGESDNAITLTPDDESVTLSKGDLFSESVPAEIAGTFAPIGLNARYLKHVLSVWKGLGAETLRLDAADSGSPMLVLCESQPDTRTVLMPMRVQTAASFREAAE